MNKRIKLGQAAEYSDKRISKKEVSLESFVTTDNILPNRAGVTIATNLPPGGNSLNRYEVDDILLANIRPYLKKIWFSNRVGGCSADVLVLKAKARYDAKFVYYAVFGDDFFNYVMKGKKGTKMPRGNKDQILDYLIPDFDFPIQQKISDILSVLDSKIELNNRINAELEAMAKTLYDY